MKIVTNTVMRGRSGNIVPKKVIIHKDGDYHYISELDAYVSADFLKENIGVAVTGESLINSSIMSSGVIDANETYIIRTILLDSDNQYTTKYYDIVKDSTKKYSAFFYKVTGNNVSSTFETTDEPSHDGLPELVKSLMPQTSRDHDFHDSTKSDEVKVNILSDSKLVTGVKLVDLYKGNDYAKMVLQSSISVTRSNTGEFFLQSDDKFSLENIKLPSNHGKVVMSTYDHYACLDVLHEF